MAGGSLEPGQAGAAPNQRKRKALADEAEALESVEELEREVADLDRRILEHLRGTATRLSDGAISRLTALRPPARPEVAVVSKTSAEDDHELEKVNILKSKVEANIADPSKTSAEDDHELEKVNILKSKVEANIADMPKLLENINETVARCEKLRNMNVNVNPVFRCFKGSRRG